MGSVRPFSEARPLFFLFMIPIFMPFMPLLSLGGSPRRSHRTTFDVTPWVSFRHFSERESQLNHGFVGDFHRRHQLCAPKMRLMSWASQSICDVGFRFPNLGSSQHRDPTKQLHLRSSPTLAAVILLLLSFSYSQFSLEPFNNPLFSLIFSYL